MADGVIATDAQGAVVRMNPVAERLTGWGTAEAKGRSLGDVFTIVHGDTHATAFLPFERTLQEGLVSEGTEQTILVARDGTELPIAFSRAPLRDSRGGVRRCDRFFDTDGPRSRPTEQDAALQLGSLSLAPWARSRGGGRNPQPAHVRMATST